MTTPTAPPTTDREPEQLRPAAAILAIVVPGAGHLYLGEWLRGAMIALGVLGLFFGGILIGGIDVIDRREDPIWFAGQALVGPIAFGADYYHQNHLKVRANDPRRGLIHRSAAPDEGRDPRSGAPTVLTPGQRPPNTKSLGRMNELGTLFATIAGMLNLIAIIDAAYFARRINDPALELKVIRGAKG